MKRVIKMLVKVTTAVLLGSYVGICLWYQKVLKDEIEDQDEWLMRFEKC